jgi:hypothetical protein
MSGFFKLNSLRALEQVMLRDREKALMFLRGRREDRNLFNITATATATQKQNANDLKRPNRDGKRFQSQVWEKRKRKNIRRSSFLLMAWQCSGTTNKALVENLQVLISDIFPDKYLRAMVSFDQWLSSML